MPDPNHRSEFRALAAKTSDIYDRHGAQFDRERSKSLFERTWLDRFLASLPPAGTILDVGCGAGEPIARYLIDRGFKVTGIDISETMISLARTRFPDQTWRVADMRTLDLGMRFDGLIGWHSFFHLTPEDQTATLARFADHLTSGGMLMMTVGPDQAETIGHVCGEPVYHASLALEDYRRILQDVSMDVTQFVPEDPDCDFASVLLARKTGVAGR